MARKLALIIGNSQYDDAGLARLAAPDVDVRALAEVLSTPGIGAFDSIWQSGTRNAPSSPARPSRPRM